MSRSKYMEGVQGGTKALVGFGVSQAARTAKSLVNNWVLQWKLRWSLMSLVFFHCQWVQAGRMDMTERVYRPGRGPRQHICVEFGVCQAARMAESEVDNGVLRWKLRWSMVPLVFFHYQWV